MLTYFFSVKENISDSSPIEMLYHEFGNNIPSYMTLEGGEGINYLFCLSIDKQMIRDICYKHKYIINGEWYGSGFTEIVVEDSMYNATHAAGVSYSGDKYYVLRKLKPE